MTMTIKPRRYAHNSRLEYKQALTAWRKQWAAHRNVKKKKSKRGQQ